MDYKNKIKIFLHRGEHYLKTDLTYFIKGSFWLFSGQVGSWFFGFILSIILANILSKDFFGNYQFILSLLGTIGAFSLTGMNTAVARAVAQGKDQVFKNSIKVQLKWNGLMMFAGFLIGIYYLINGNQTIGWSLIMASLFLPLANAFNTYSAFLNGKKDFKKMSLYGIVISLTVSLSILVASLLYKSIPFIIGVYSITTFIANYYAYKIIIKNSDFSNDSDETSIKYGKQLSIINFFSSISSEFDKIILFHYSGGVILASYFIATLIPGNLQNFFRLIHPLSLPKFSQRSRGEIREKIYHKLFIILLLSLLLTITYIALAPILFHLMFPTYSDIIGLTRIYSLTIIFTGPAILLSSVLSSQAMVKQIYIFNILTFVARMMLVFFGIKIAGIYGLAWGMVILNALVAATLFILVSNIKIKKQQP